MIKAKDPLVMDNSEKETVRLILLGLINYFTYGMAAERMFSTEISETVEQVRESLKPHSIILAQKSTETRYRGMPPPTQPVRLPEDLYNSINKLLVRLLRKLDTTKNGPKKDVKRNGRSGAGRAKRVKAKVTYRTTQPNWRVS